MRTKIYTKTGDAGKTGLLGGARVSKGDPRIDVYGTLDELNSFLGLCVAHFAKELEADLKKTFTLAQHRLFNLGSLMACTDPKLKAALPTVSNQDIEFLEKEIDRLTEKLPELKQFILPGGSVSASHIHVARGVCRRAERKWVNFTGATPQEDDLVGIRFLNRLGDYLFVAGRYANHKLEIQDIVWQKE